MKRGRGEIILLEWNVKGTAIVLAVSIVIVEESTINIIPPYRIGIVVYSGAFELFSCIMMGWTWTEAVRGGRFCAVAAATSHG